MRKHPRRPLSGCWAVLVLFSILALAASSARAGSCGDDVGGVRIPCACGDVVVSDTRLQADDPVVTTRCSSDEHTSQLNVQLPETPAQAPLAWRMRPRELSELVGQEHILGPGKLLRRAIEADRFMSLILYGPPGAGKTALAHLIAERSQAHFLSLNAVTAGVADIRRVAQEAGEERARSGKRTLLFIDEIHRFTRVQQDALLPDVERGAITLIGASTQNPFFAIIPALSSRSQIFEFKPLRDDDIRPILVRALADRERGLGSLQVQLTDDAREYCNNGN